MHTAFIATTVTLLAAAMSIGPVRAATPLVEKVSDVRPDTSIELEILTLSEAAALLRIEPATVVRLAQARKIPARQIEAEWRFSRSALVAWLAGDWTIRTLVEPATTPWPSGPVLTTQAGAAIVGRGMLVDAVQATDATPTAASPSLGVGPGQRTANDMFLRDQQVLLAPNEMTLDIGLLYARRDRHLLTQSNGGAALANAESEAFSTQLTARYNLHSDTEFFASTSFLRQQASVYAGDERLNRAARAEMGDIGVGVRHTLLREGAGRPDVIVSLDARIPTGVTSRAIGTALTLVKSLDPVVLFGTLGYRHTFSRGFADVLRLEPRHRVDLTLGYAFALNDTLSLNTAIASTFNRGVTINTTQLRPVTTTALQLGMTVRVARGLYLQPSMSYRLSGPGSGFSLGLNVPITF